MNVTTQNRKRKIGRGIVGGLLLAAVAGCGPVSKEDQERILLSEPGFARVMEQKKEVDRKIGWAKAEFAGESAEIKKRIAELKNELVLARKRHEQKLRQLKSELDPERQRIRQAVEELSSRRKLYRQNLKNMKDMNRAADGLQKTGNTGVPPLKPRAGWQGDLGALKEQIKQLEEEVRQLEERLRLRRLQLQLLRQ